MIWNCTPPTTYLQIIVLFVPHEPLPAGNTIIMLLVSLLCLCLCGCVGPTWCTWPASNFARHWQFRCPLACLTSHCVSNKLVACWQCFSMKSRDLDCGGIMWSSHAWMSTSYRMNSGVFCLGQNARKRRIMILNLLLLQSLQRRKVTSRHMWIRQGHLFIPLLLMRLKRLFDCEAKIWQLRHYAWSMHRPNDMMCTTVSSSLLIAS